MTKNGNGNGGERDDKGRFLPGKPGGPGRGKTKSGQELSEAIEEIKELLQNDDADLTSSKALQPVGCVLLHGITSKDSKVRTDSAKLYFAWVVKMRESIDREKQEDSGASPEEVKRFAEIVRMRQNLDVMEAEGITDLFCSERTRKLGIDEGLKENDRC